MRVKCVLLLAALAPGIAVAQPLAVAGGPTWFSTLGVGLHFGAFIVDDGSDATWDFDAGVAWRGTLERNVVSDISVGIAWQYARLPLSYRSLSQSGTCAVACAADATVGFLGLVGRSGGGGLGFQRLIEVSVGALRYGSFQGTTAGVGRLAPESGNTDFAMGFGGGFGYGITPDWQVMLVQDALYSIHERSLSPMGAGRITQHYSTRLGVRIGW